MNDPRKLFALAGAAVALAAGAIIVMRPAGTPGAGAPSSASVGGTIPAGQPLLGARAADVAKDAARVRIQRADKVVELARSADGRSWTVASRDMYPALDERVRELVRGITTAQVVEAKTAVPSLHPRVGLGDPTADGATNALVTLLGSAPASGGEAPVLASVVIGNRQESPTGEVGKATTFVRERDNNQSYLVRAVFNLGFEPIDWMPRLPLSLPPASFHTLRTTHASGEVVTLTRAGRGEESVRWDQMPEGRELVDPMALSRSLMALQELSIDDVRSASGVDLSSGATTTVTTFDGLVFTMRTATLEDKPLVNVRVAFDASKALPEAESTPESIAAASEMFAKQAQELDARLGPWAFQVPSGKLDQLAPSAATLLKPVPAPEPVDLTAPGAPEAPATP